MDVLPLQLPGLALVPPLAGAAAVLTWRLRETRRPLSTPRIVMPPLGMSTGFGMFLLPSFRVPWAWAAGAFVLGAAVLAIPLVRSSTLVRQGAEVVLRRSRAFLLILLGLVAVRFLLRAWVGTLVTPRQTAALVFVLAFGMILRWRVGMYRDYRRLVRTLD